MKTKLFLIAILFFASNATKSEVAPPYFATLTINIPNAQAADIRDSLCLFWGYAGNPADNAAKMEFMRVRVAAYLKQQYIDAKSVIAAETARTTNADVDIN